MSTGAPCKTSDTCEVSEVSISVPAEGGEITFITKTDVEFEVSTEVEWITITSDGRAVEEYTVVAEVAANEESATRTGIITVQFMDDNATVKEVNVVQSGVPVSADGVITVEVHATGSTTVYAPAEIEEYLDVTLDELEDGAVTDGEVYYYGINHDGTMYDGDWTTNAVGYWYNTDEDVCEWGEPDPYGTGAERLAYLEGDGYYFSLGFEDHDAYVGKTITLRGMYVHGDYSVEVDYVVYVEEKQAMEELPAEFEIYFDLMDSDYNIAYYDMSDNSGNESVLNFTGAQLAAAVDASFTTLTDLETAILSDDVYVTTYGSNGELITYSDLTNSYNCTGEYGLTGWWFDQYGMVTEWGDDSYTYITDETGGDPLTFTYGLGGIFGPTFDVGETEYLAYIAYVNATDETADPVLVKFRFYVEPVETPETPEASSIVEIDNVVITNEGSYTITNTYLTTINNALGCDVGSASLYMYNPEDSDLALAGTYPGNSALPDTYGYDGSGPTDGWFNEFGPCNWDGGVSNISCLKNLTNDHYTFTTYTDGATNTDALCSFEYVNNSSETSILVYIYASHN